MHLEPGLTTTGKKKGKPKFRNAEAAKRHRDLEQQWSDLQKKWQVDEEKKKKNRALTSDTYKPEPVSYRGSSQPRIPSSQKSWDPCIKNPDQVYTGDSCIGVTILHKSCLQPVFSKQEAVDAAKMRR